MPTPPRRTTLVRVLPFLVFMALLGARGAAQQHGWVALDPQWLYAVTVALVGALLWHWRRDYGELARQNLPNAAETVMAAGVGVAVFALWISLDAPWMQLGEPTAPFHPLHADGRIDWGLVAVRWLGAALLVPVMEELFWRAFLMRWIDRPRFESVDPRSASLKAVVLSTFIFMLAHTLWLAAIVAGLAYAWLYVRSGKLWTAVIAHAVTNALLGAWVVATGSWQFW
jgi:CAAX prenyl protease-like protein